MMTARQTLVAAALIATLMSAAEPAAADSPASPAIPPHSSGAASLLNPRSEIIALEQERHTRFTLPVQVEGSGPFAFLIDTGSQATAITDNVRIAANLAPAGRVVVVGMASRREVELARVRRIDFGANSFTNFSAPVLAREHVGADGIIGLDALQDLRVLIDFRAQTIALEDAAAKESRKGYEIVVRAREKLGQLLITNALVEGVRATVIIDTGAQYSLGNLALREQIRAKRAEEVITTDVNGVDIVGQLAFVRSLTIEGLSLSDVPLTFADTPAFEALGLSDEPTLAIGMQHLALFDRVAIDFSRQRILFDVPADVARALRNARHARNYRF